MRSPEDSEQPKTAGALPRELLGQAGLSQREKGMPGGDPELEKAKQQAKEFGELREAMQKETDAQKAAAAEAAKNTWTMRILSGREIKDVTLEGADGQAATDPGGWKVNGATSTGSPPAAEIKKPAMPPEQKPVEEKKSRLGATSRQRAASEETARNTRMYRHIFPRNFRLSAALAVLCVVTATAWSARGQQGAPPPEPGLGPSPCRVAVAAAAARAAGAGHAAGRSARPSGVAPGANCPARSAVVDHAQDPRLQRTPGDDGQQQPHPHAGPENPAGAGQQPRASGTDAACAEPDPGGGEEGGQNRDQSLGREQTDLHR